MEHVRMHSGTRFGLTCSAVVVLSVVGLLSPSLGWAGTGKALHDFAPVPRGADPQSSLIADSSGALYGTAQKGSTFELGTVFKLVKDGDGKWTESVLHKFEGYPNDGENPVDGLVLDGTGNLYGMTPTGGAHSQGTLFEVSPSSGGRWTETIIYNFTGGADGGDPTGGLVFDGMGNLYGVATFGGSYGDGAVFELSPSSGGWTETVLYSFTGGADGANPYVGLVFDATGNLYGVTAISNVNGYNDGPGLFFELTPSSSGWSETVLYTFVYSYPVNPPGLVFDQSGNLYGTGSNAAFELSRSAGGQWVQTVLHQFGKPGDGNDPVAGVVLDSLGNLYGTTREGGRGPGCYYGCGTVYELKPESGNRWRETILHSFWSPNDGMEPEADVLLDLQGNVYGTTAAGGPAGLGTVFELRPKGDRDWPKSSLYDFPGGDGASSYAGLVSDSTGVLYGTTVSGGAYGFGSVFKLTPAGDHWTESLVYSFKGKTDGANPRANVIFDQSGSLYGTTTSGGNACGCGTIVELKPKGNGHWKENTLYRFSEYPGNVSSLVFDGLGNLFGTTLRDGLYGAGTVFELSPSGNGTWTETAIYNFGYRNDGSEPMSGVIVDDVGNLYGTTTRGGPRGYGAVFELSGSGSKWTETILYSFQCGADGCYPQAPLIFDDGHLYGAAVGGGGGNCDYGCGTIFQLSHEGATWTETVVYSFKGLNEGDGANPVAGLALDGGGNLYGTTADGGDGSCPYGCGTVFEVSPGSSGWTEKVLYTFVPGPGGVDPQGGVILGTDGALYGTTVYGGLLNNGWDTGVGAVFEVTP